MAAFFETTGARGVVVRAEHLFAVRPGRRPPLARAWRTGADGRLVARWISRDAEPALGEPLAAAG